MVPLNRALSKLGILSRAQATEAIRAGRVKVDGRVVIDPAASVVPEKVRITVDGQRRTRASWRTILFHKPRGVVTTRTDPEGRPTILRRHRPLRAGTRCGRTSRSRQSGLLLLTTDTRLANRITDPANAVPRVYLVTVRGRVAEEDAARLEAASVIVRKASNRETHLTVELRRGRNREVRKLFAAIGHEVTKLKRVRFGGLELGGLSPGSWRELTRTEVEAAFHPAI